MVEIHEELVENTIPVLAVRDVQESLRFYCQRLQFQRDWGGDGEMRDIASVSRDDHPIMLQRSEPSGSGCVWLGVSNLSEIWRLVCSSDSVRVIQRPTNQPWGLEMKIQDPDGNILWFGTDPLPDVPLGEECSNLLS